MAWIRLTDNYDSDEQIIVLSHGAFRLWHQGLAWCRRNVTNEGIIPFTVLRTLSAFSKGREKELATASRPELQPLWVLIPHVGYRIKSYLKWYPGREQLEKEQTQNRDRQAQFRARNAVTPPPRNAVTPEKNPALSLERKGSDLPVEEDDAEIFERAGRLREELYPAWYATFRHGARLRLVANSLEFQDAVTICRTWDDARIAQLAEVFLTTDEPWIAGTDRGFRVFATKISWCDDRLKQAEMRRA